jgi:putative NADH-flavin reductase
MRITIIAATGGIGRHLLEQCLDRGHEVTAVVRNPGKLIRPVRTVQMDLTAPDPAGLAGAVDGADAVLSAYGPHGRADAGIAASGTRAVIEAMHTTTVRRLVVVSAAPVLSVPPPGRPHPPRHDPAEGLVMRYVAGPVFRRLFATHLADLAVMEDAVRDSGLDWTVVRPPQLTDKPLGAYRTVIEGNPHRYRTASRADVADFMLRALDDPSTVKHAIGIAR